MKIKYDAQLMKLMDFFETNTNSKLKDCLIDRNGILTFIVKENIGLAIGKNGATAKKIEFTLKRKIKIAAIEDPEISMTKMCSDIVIQLRECSIRNIELIRTIPNVSPNERSIHQLLSN